MKSPGIEDKDTEDMWEFDESPVARFVLMILLNASKRGVERIHFERYPEENGESDNFVISNEMDGIHKETEDPPWEKWADIIRRLKIIARMVDYGPKKSVDGQIIVRLAKNRSVEFFMTTNPNPYSDNKVTLVYKG